jgi:hypothetical protein
VGFPLGGFPLGGFAPGDDADNADNVGIVHRGELTLLLVNKGDELLSRDDNIPSPRDELELELLGEPKLLGVTVVVLKLLVRVVSICCRAPISAFAWVGCFGSFASPGCFGAFAMIGVYCCLYLMGFI